MNACPNSTPVTTTVKLTSLTYQLNARDFVKRLRDGRQAFVQTSDRGADTARSDHGGWVQHELAVCKTHGTNNFQVWIVYLII